MHDSLSLLFSQSCGFSSDNRAEVPRRCLQMLQWTVEQPKRQGGTILGEKNGCQREVVFPFLTSKAEAASK